MLFDITSISFWRLYLCSSIGNFCESSFSGRYIEIAQSGRSDMDTNLDNARKCEKSNVPVVALPACAYVPVAADVPVVIYVPIAAYVPVVIYAPVVILYVPVVIYVSVVAYIPLVA